jgi:predicted Rossmann fold flavoprotein
MDEGCNKVVIIGGGAAGYFAAITAAEKKPNAQVILFEAGDRVLRKVKISGGGRCNLTHHCYEPKDLSSHYPRGSKELRGAFHHWQPRDTIEWFETRGVKTKVETDGRIFPVSDNSQSVIDCLRTEAKNLGVSEHLRTRVSYLKQTNNQWELEINQSEKIIADQVCLALGSLRGTGMEKTLTALGHIISPLIPSLFAFNLPEHPMVELAGISVPHALAKTLPNGKPQHGPLLITHRGLSGPCILRLSAWDAKELAVCKYKFEIEINWLGDHSLEKIKEVVSLYRKQFAVAKVSTNPSKELPKRLWAHLVDHAKISRDTTWAHLSKKEEQKLVKALGSYRCKVSGKTTNKEEFVTCGGVSLKQVDFRTMESKLVPGLHFAGECIDYDGITGGFNFQGAWTTGRIAGLAIATDPS